MAEHVERNESGDTTPREARVRVHARRLLELTSRLSEPLSTEEVARIVVDQSGLAVGISTALMWTVDEPPTHATLVRAIGCPPEAEARYAHIPLEPWLPMGDAILRREALFFESLAEYGARYPAALRGGHGGDLGHELSYACLPLVVHGRAIGGISLVFPGTRAFDEDERVFLTVLAHHAAQALERASLVERQAATRRRLEHLQQLTAAMSSAVTVEEIAHLAARVGTEALGVLASALWEIDEHGDFRLLGSYRTTETMLGPFRQMPGNSNLPAARIAREKKPVWYERESDVEAEPSAVAEVLGRGDEFRAFGALPLVRGDRVLGVLAFSAGRPRRFSPEERSFAETIASHCADAITRARLYEEARCVERRLQSLLDRLPVGVIAARAPDGDLIFANDAMARLWRAKGFPSRGEDRGRALQARLPDGRPLVKTDWPIVRALRGEVVEGEELQITRLDGDEAWVRTHAAPIRREDGTIEAAVATAIDITEEKAARASAVEADRAKDEFLAMVGHELRNPLAPIVTALHLMRMRDPRSLEGERKVIERQVNHLTRLVDDLLDVSRAVRGKLRLERAPVEVAAVVADAIEMAAPLVEERKHRLTVSVPRTGLLVEADAERLAQMVTNLLTNAAKYTPPGGHITVQARGEGEQVVLEVADDGTGIAPELLPRVFDAFAQGRQGLDRTQGGLGLGLAIARQLIVAHGGSIEARSAGVGLGTTIVVRLPGADAPLQVNGRAREAAFGARSRGRHRVLVVDDNPDAAGTLKEALAEAGHEVRTAADGPSALQLVETFAPDIAFLDIGLPVMDGYELARQLRRLPRLAVTPLVAVTGYTQDDDRQRALACGFAEHLGKPLDFDRILHCIEQLCPAGT